MKGMELLLLLKDSGEATDISTLKEEHHQRGELFDDHQSVVRSGIFLALSCSLGRMQQGSRVPGGYLRPNSQSVSMKTPGIL